MKFKKYRFKILYQHLPRKRKKILIIIIIKNPIKNIDQIYFTILNFIYKLNYSLSIIIIKIYNSTKTLQHM